MNTCPNCGCRVHRLGCVNCDEEAYINEQIALTEAQYPAKVGSHGNAVLSEASPSAQSAAQKSSSDSFDARTGEGR